ncbi:hypothetical protein COY52_08700 [Candidatus Desantisbacteria bacterium CG_4_10_14_0_8_um_filter_48_22]|uniref:CMP/dCMP-type deaminase domain-containing protein n=1 Tax=Candidatus Desantisbacteria bacterium CG_4_10_14_0_8_um_filter_48_22 TaxID=1974543 RepID=A0A2M7S975_9BACT|nr:MAG: hypothetical protein COS16_02860 [Candidatus Desantisbacteria bacterium CG02_land_8_20_14_3_00_49_13]PIZ15863.1 MAG: hypothetical protein COY52_08700 [Candidatus Desantisbacteria bacterium CG_4_10_14_0_8_um_filter_48_22]
MKNSSKTDRKFMKIAIEEMLLSRSEHAQKPDPMVGTVLVDKSGKELGRAHRSIFTPGDHGEFSILEKVRPDIDPSGCTLYVTLEPCTERENPKKIPCAQRIVEKKIDRVVIGILDPNPKICGFGKSYLENYGIKVNFFDKDLVEEIRIWNKDFIDFMQNNKQKLEGSMSKLEDIELPSQEEQKPYSDATIKDFSNETIKKYMKYRSDISYTVPSKELWTFFRKNRYLVKGDKGDVPTLAGIVLFGKDPSIFIPEHRILAECFGGTPENGASTDKTIGNGKKNITGPLFEMTKTAEDFYKTHIRKVPLIKGFQRVDEELEYPKEVIREAIVNALVHRDYRLGGHISFQIFRDRIVIKNPGSILRPNTIERMNSFDVTPARRNPIIAEAAEKMMLMEKKGRGIPDMSDQLQKYGLRPPNFAYDGYLIVTLYGREKTPPEYRIQKEFRSSLTDRQLKILNFIWEQGRVNSEETTKKFDITRETANQDFRKLLKLGLIEKKGTGRATYYILGNI